ncbi:MAG TPA: hypothetical protein VFI25_08260 [Planctomycetota bacterium]|nr:hypothetical protein [Planctomycetota bacterium]
MAGSATVWTILALYVAALAVCTAWARRRTKDLADYYVGGRRLPAWILALSYFATYVSTNTYVGLAGKSYAYGASWLLLGAVLLVFSVVGWRWIGPRMAEVAAENGLLTVPEFFARRFGSPAAGTLAALLIVLDSVWYLTAVFQGAAASAGSLLGIGPAGALLFVVSVQVAYTLTGGFLSDAITDAVQAVLMLGAALLLPVAFVAAGGGPSAVLERLRAIDAAPDGPGLLSLAGGAPLLFILGLSVSGGIKLLADPRQTTRFYGAASAAPLRRMAWLAPAAIGLTYLLVLPLGLFARALDLPPEVAAHTDRIVPHLLGPGRVVGPTVGAFLLCAFLAAAMSSADSVLLVAASAIQRDLLGRFASGSPWSTELWAGRAFVVAYAIVPAILATWHPPDIVGLTAFAGALYAGAFLPGILAGLRRSPPSEGGRAVVASMVAGAGAAYLWKFAVLRAWPSIPVHEVFASLAAGFGAYATFRTLDLGRGIPRGRPLGAETE